jgi:hypothetical protein
VLNGSPPTLVVDLHRKGFFRREFVCHSPLPQARDYTFGFSGSKGIVHKGGRPWLETDGHGFLRIDDERYEAGQSRFWRQVEWLRRGTRGFRFVWGDWQRAPAARFDGVLVTVDGSPHERYLVRQRDTGLLYTVTQVNVQALDGRGNLDRMMALLAFFWVRREVERNT